MRGINWANGATVVAALTAAVGLVFTAISTYYGARVAEDQLEQSRADAQRKIQRQANLVSVWATDFPERAGIVANRSPDPVGPLMFVFWAYDDSFGIPIGGYYYELTATSLAGCSQIVIAPDKLKELRGRHAPKGGISMWGVRFLDTNGRQWAREAAGPPEEVRGTSFLEPSRLWKNVERKIRKAERSSTPRGSGGQTELAKHNPEPLEDCSY
ncbi:hypothetical protein MMF93_13620 [Streptomyces tubbatahanensis]|uniref:Uncharacterized protein n=1 Tax=Streptomyces tubbatahanensis TaxID=2923272 RepID=A0ABY3XSP2_9ACTN|nr:hypothetical protein [Streptomyces tubbatahanensis]UNS97420.1 hypothetical protein MMF93_13620 [Streptomyces tubbatahanensis]